MNETIVPTTTSIEWTHSNNEKFAQTTQVVGEIVIIAGALYLLHKGYRALVNRSVRKELRKNK